MAKATGTYDARTGPARALPGLDTLTGDQAAGRACIWCKRLLTTGAVNAGTIRERMGAHVLDTEVWACPPCDAGEGVRR